MLRWRGGVARICIHAVAGVGRALPVSIVVGWVALLGRPRLIHRGVVSGELVFLERLKGRRRGRVKGKEVAMGIQVVFNVMRAWYVPECPTV